MCQLFELILQRFQGTGSVFSSERRLKEGFGLIPPLSERQTSKAVHDHHGTPASIPETKEKSTAPEPEPVEE